MAGNIPFHPAPNRALGELLPGFFDVPQNPITAREYGIGYTPTLGEIMPGMFTVPQNPIVAFGTGNVLPIGVMPGAPGTLNGQPIGSSMAGMGCGCGGGNGGCGCGGGMGDVSADLSVFMSDLTAGNISQAMSDPIFGFPAWGFVAAGIAAFFYFGAPSEGSSRIRRGRRRLGAAIAG